MLIKLILIFLKQLGVSCLYMCDIYFSLYSVTLYFYILTYRLLVFFHLGNDFFREDSRNQILKYPNLILKKL